MGGRIDVLVNCAGIQRRSPSLDFLETDWDDVRARYAPHPVLYFSYYDHALSYFTSASSFVYLDALRSWTSTSSPSGSFLRLQAVTWFQGGKEKS
jgi:NAD(P)-dependent dehydrogenase (short-subunit alcohol dehydrogenase family)